MVAVSDVIARARAVGATLNVEDGRLRAIAPKGAISPRLAQEIADNRDGIIAALTARPTTCYDCRTTHPDVYACDGKGFLIGDVIEDTPVLWRRAIHCPVCCPIHGTPRRQWKKHNQSEGLV